MRASRPRSASDAGVVYILRRGEAYKIGFTRNLPNRLARISGAELILAFYVERRPSQFEHLLNNRFSDRRLPPQGSSPGDRREWFALTTSDLEWLSGLAAHLNSSA